VDAESGLGRHGQGPGKKVYGASAASQARSWTTFQDDKRTHPVRHRVTHPRGRPPWGWERIAMPDHHDEPELPPDDGLGDLQAMVDAIPLELPDSDRERHERLARTPVIVVDTRYANEVVSAHGCTVDHTVPPGEQPHGGTA
jgi:hypothetical protein